MGQKRASNIALTNIERAHANFVVNNDMDRIIDIFARRNGRDSYLRGCEAIRVINWDEFVCFFLFFFVMVVANCNASCYWLHVHCSQWQLLLFFSIRNQDCICRNMEGFMRWACILLDEMHKPWNCCERWAYFMHDKLLVKWTSSKAKICCSKLTVFHELFMSFFKTDNQITRKR